MARQTATTSAPSSATSHASEHSDDQLTHLSWKWILGFWWLVATVATVTKLIWWHLILPETENQFSIPGRIAYQFIFYTCWALFTPHLFRFSAWLLRPRSWTHRILYVTGAALATSAGMGLLRSCVHNIEHKNPYFHGFGWIARDSIGRVHEDLMMFVAVMAVGLASRYYAQREAQRSAAAALRAELATARLQALQMQLNPHFLFNALNSISGLVEHDPKATRTVVARLSELLRRSLDATDHQEVSLGEELQFTQCYLDIMEIRFGDRLRVSTNVPSELLDAYVPAFVLQPLVENAFEHGLSHVSEVGQLTIRATRTGAQLVLSVEDNGPGPSEATAPKLHGIGLANVRARLQALYPNAASVELAARAGGGAKATITLPYQVLAERSVA